MVLSEARDLDKEVDIFICNKHTTPLGILMVEKEENEMPMAPSPTHRLVTVVYNKEKTKTQKKGEG
jgi:hypothetical protein